MSENTTGAYAEKIENYIARVLPETREDLRPAVEMMRYTLSSGGKRVRPLLTLLFCAAAGGDPERALPFAAAVELVHTYSLIHDDLPCMDDDDLRRGKPSSHVVFGEGNAVLAGDALLTCAFGVAANAGLDGTVSPLSAAKACAALSKLAGVEGMVGGQFLDLKYENADPDADVLFTIDALKTGALIAAAGVLGLLAADAGEEMLAAARAFGRDLGLAFQITDDLLEYADENETSDEKNGKATYVKKLGAEAAGEKAAYYTEKAVQALDIFGEKGGALKAFARALLKRKV